ncbi:MAG: alpha/beta fold hydrolase [Clostridia bacterium]|nr:alpha/beta fold hydrolase [Clostridia bacterium]
MKERIACVALALVLVISMFGVMELFQNPVKASTAISNLEGDVIKDQAETLNIFEERETPEAQLMLFEATAEPTEETVAPTEPPIVSEYYDQYFDESIEFSSEYISDGEVMPYALYTPSTLDETKKTPLIVWLHGSGEVGVTEGVFWDRGLPKTMNEWGLEGFNAYIICPHLAGNWNTGRWNKDTTKNNLQVLLDKFMMEHNIDTEQVIVVGHSLGGQGALYMAHELPEYFSKCVVLSGYNSGVDISEISIPTIGFVGTREAGEDGTSVNYMVGSMADAFGADKVISLQSSHGNLPRIVFNLDSDGNHRPDLVEWMLGEFEF